MRICFVTPEFLIEKPSAGGLGNYVNRMAQALQKEGHEVDIFTLRHSKEAKKVDEYMGIKVFHVTRNKGLFFQLIKFLDNHIFCSKGSRLTNYLSGAYTVGKAVNIAQKESPYDLIQIANSGLLGLFISRSHCPNLVIRISSVRRLCHKFDGLWHLPGSKMETWLEEWQIKKIRYAYAPSEFTANFFNKYNVKVIRPPFFIERKLDVEYKMPIQRPFFIHFGSIGNLKGSEDLAIALLKVWESEPDFEMIWVGGERTNGAMDTYRKWWGKKSENVIWIESLRKPQLYTLIKNSSFAVLPSKVDNLPNTVLESLTLGTPVIGYNGASINEMVVHNKNGYLAEMGKIDELASLILKAFRNVDKTIKGFIPEHLALELDTNYAVNKLLNFIKK
ncbi:glycosyltransferase family 4 protein [Fulvivirgaceae bacterium LMO-SS25]